jgi:hypothetical protein
MLEDEQDVKHKSNKKAHSNSNLEATKVVSDDMPCLPPRANINFLMKKPPIVFVSIQTEKCGYTKPDMVGGIIRYKTEIIMKVTNKMQLYRLIYYSLSAIHVSVDVFARHREHLTVFTISGSILPGCCLLGSWMS